MLTPITRVSMYKDIVDQLIDCIKTGVWQPGDHLPTEMELSQIFHVSRNSIREALKSLSYSGILSARAGRGTFITADALQKIENLELVNFISEEASMNDLMETRILLETELARLAALRANDSDKLELKEVMQQLEDQLVWQEAGHISSNPTEIGTTYHMCIAKIAKNKVLMRLMQSIQNELKEQRSKVELNSAQDFDVMLSDHKRIYEAIVSNNPDLAAELMRNHVLHSFENIQAQRTQKIKE